ncbi:MAG TPA: XRE family transcriptional regulator [Dongiaceae bacterium]|nr:XRE family transcriptional regulator [Dongiaceae bacterium]
MSRKNRTGSTVDTLWEELGILEDVQELAIRKMLAVELGRAMKRRKWTKADLARQLDTSRPQLDRLLDPLSPGGITIHTLAKAARVIGKKIEIKLLPAA